MNRCFLIIAFLVLSTLLVKADNITNNKMAKISNQYTDRKKYNAEPIPEANMKADYGNLVKKLPERVNESPDFMKKNQYDIKKSADLFRYSNIYISLGLGQEYLYSMKVNDKLTSNYDIPDYAVNGGKFMPAKDFDIAPLSFDISVGYRPFEKEIFDGLRFELNVRYITKNEYRMVNYDTLFKSSNDVNHEVYKSDLNKTSYSIGLLSFYDFYFLTKEQDIIVPYVGLGIYKTFGKLDMVSSYIDRKDGKTTLKDTYLNMNNDSIDLSQHIGVNLFRGYFFADYSFNTHISKHTATSSLVKIGFRIPLAGV